MWLIKLSFATLKKISYYKDIMKKKILQIIIFFAFLSGCAGPNVTISHYKHPPASERVQRAADKFYFYQESVPAIANRKIYTRVYESNEKNAYVDYNKYYITIGISDSLVNELDNEALLSVFAHECAHAEYGHIGKIMAVSQAVSLAVQVADAVVPEYGLFLTDAVLNPLITRSYSRKEEIQADTRALYYLANMGVSYESFVKLLEILKTDAPDKKHRGGLLDTHPSLEARIENAKFIGVKYSLTDEIEAYREPQIQKYYSNQNLDLETRYPFDLGPYGKSKAVLLEKYLSEEQVISLFDGLKPNKIKKANSKVSVWIYDIPQRKYCFYIFMRKDSNGIFWLNKYVIDEKNKRIKNLETFI